MTSPDDRLEVVCGRVSTQVANTYFRWTGDPSVTIDGYVEGPFSTFGKTLPSRTELIDAGPGATKLLRAAIPDPVFWTPLHPTLYNLHCQIHSPGGEVLSAERRFGIRFFGAYDRSFIMEAKRWVFRGLCGDYENDEQFAECRELAAGLVMRWESERPISSIADRLGKATDFGIPVVVELLGVSSDMQQRLADLAWHPAVLIAVVDSDQALTDQQAQAAANICLAQRVSSPKHLQPLKTWANVAWIEIDENTRANYSAKEFAAPVMVVRRSQGSLSERRAACDVLQRDMVQFGDFAAYIV